MATTGFLKINGQDAFTAYGMVVKPTTYARLLKLPKRKENGLTTSFVEENGLDVYLPNPTYEALSVQLPFWLMGKNETDFFNKYEALRALVLQGTELNWDFMKMAGKGRRFILAYEDMTDLKTLTPTSGGAAVYCEFVLQLRNNYPTQNFKVT